MRSNYCLGPKKPPLWRQQHILPLTCPTAMSMRHLRNLALEGVRVLQGTNEQDREAMPRRNIPPVEPFRNQAAAPAVAPRPWVVEPINGELRHGLAQNRVNSARARRDARCFKGEAELEHLGIVIMDCVARSALAS
jgi:hypothetical protein